MLLFKTQEEVNSLQQYDIHNTASRPHNNVQSVTVQPKNEGNDAGGPA